MSLVLYPAGHFILSLGLVTFWYQLLLVMNDTPNSIIVVYWVCLKLC